MSSSFLSGGAGAMPSPSPSPAPAAPRSHSSLLRAGTAAPRWSRAVYTRTSLLGLSRVDTAQQCWSADVYIEFVFAYPRAEEAAAALAAEQAAAAAVTTAAAAAAAAAGGGAVSDSEAAVRRARLAVAAAQHAAAEKTQAQLRRLEPPLHSSHSIDLSEKADLFHTAILWPKLLNQAGESVREVWATKCSEELCLGLLRTDRQLARFGDDLAEARRRFYFVSVNLRIPQGDFAQRFRLDDFPFDEQMLRLRVTLNQDSNKWHFAGRGESAAVYEHSTGGGASRHIVAVDGGFTGTLAEWTLGKTVETWSSFSSPALSRTQLQYAHLTLLFRVTRRYGHFVLNVIMPLAFLLVCSCLSTYLDGAEQYAGGATLLIFAFQIKSQAAEYLPRMGTTSLLASASPRASPLRTRITHARRLPAPPPFPPSRSRLRRRR